MNQSIPTINEELTANPTMPQTIKNKSIDLSSTFARLISQAESATDFVADTRDLEAHVSYRPDTHEARVHLSAEGDARKTLETNGKSPNFMIGPNGHRQLAEKLGIAPKYYDRMAQDAPDLLVENINHWLENEPKRTMIRTLNGSVRAVLSDRYRRIDHLDILKVALPKLESNGYQITDFQLSETRLILRAVYPETVELNAIGDVAQRGIRISNSEVGRGALVSDPFVRILSCLNGMTMEDHRLRRHHVGAAISEGLLTETTMRAEEGVFLMKSGDLIDAIADGDRFKMFWHAINTAGEMTVESPLASAELLAKKVGLNKGEGEAVRDGFLRAADPTVWGLLQSLTAFAHQGDMGSEFNMDRRAELESAAGQILLDTNTRNALVAAA